MTWDDQANDCTMRRNVSFVSLDLLSSPECDALIDALRRSSEEQAPVYGLGERAVVNPLARRTTRLMAPPETCHAVSSIFERLRQTLSDEFEVSLSRFEAPQFLRYTAGDYFVAHQDGNTPIIVDDSRHRRVSLILFLSDPASYSGGDLVFHGRPPEVVSARRGSAVAFRSELTHEVTPLTGGERFTVVTWYR